MKTFGDKAADAIMARGRLCVAIDPALPGQRDKMTIGRRTQQLARTLLRLPPSDRLSPQSASALVERMRRGRFAREPPSPRGAKAEQQPAELPHSGASRPLQFRSGAGLQAEDRVKFCVGMVGKVSPYCSAVKFNQQYLFGLTRKEHLEITGAAKKRGLFSILDYKLCDIGDSVDSALFHIAASGYDTFTFNPFAGNLGHATREAHRLGLGIIALTLMSNPEANWIGGLFRKVARQVKKSGADGCVVGATGHVSRSDMRDVVKLAGREKLFLVPGIGAQGGDAARIIGAFREAGAEKPLLVVGRSIIYSKNPEKAAAHYSSYFRDLYFSEYSSKLL